MDYQEKLIELNGVANFMLFLCEHLSQDECDRLVELQFEYFKHLASNYALSLNELT
jgi:hypothetical protein